MLVVDDDADLRDVITIILTGAGYVVRTAANGQEALEMVARQLPALILLDMKMPVMSGWTFAEEFRSRYDRMVPIVVLTAASDARQRAEEIGAEGWLSKPFDVTELLDTVAHYSGTDSSPAARTAPRML
jgi:CheY-like chemotaxis protein